MTTELRKWFVNKKGCVEIQCEECQEMNEVLIKPLLDEASRNSFKKACEFFDEEIETRSWWYENHIGTPALNSKGKGCCGVTDVQGRKIITAFNEFRKDMKERWNELRKVKFTQIKVN